MDDAVRSCAVICAVTASFFSLFFYHCTASLGYYNGRCSEKLCCDFQQRSGAFAQSVAKALNEQRFVEVNKILLGCRRLGFRV